MQTATINWTLPTTRESGLPLSPTDIAGVEVAMSADAGVNFGVVVPIATSGVVVPDLEPGTWVVRLTVVDTLDVRGALVDTIFEVLDNSPPGSVVEVTVDLA